MRNTGVMLSQKKRSAYAKVCRNEKKIDKGGDGWRKNGIAK